MSNYNYYTKITNYDQIVVQDDTLLVMDFDETIIHYPYINSNWWGDTSAEYAKKDPETAEKNTYNDWMDIIIKHKARMLDEEEFSKLLLLVKNTNSTIVIVTARHNRLTRLTYNELNDCGIYNNIEEVYFSNKKGLTVKKIKHNHKHIVFVDDKLSNINDVKYYNPSATVYHMNHINL
uniref:FCP1 homology domain-containing protein n=1 Tax=viral metagenome TaxID=1070528 RepID=A0A6C0JLX0_9ZZZZ